MINLNNSDATNSRKPSFPMLYASQKALEKCCFVKIGKEKGFADARQTEIEEYINKLSD